MDSQEKLNPVKTLAELQTLPVYLANKDESVFYEISEGLNLAVAKLAMVNGVCISFHPRLTIEEWWFEHMLSDPDLHEVDEEMFRLKLTLMSKFIADYVQGD